MSLDSVLVFGAPALIAAALIAMLAGFVKGTTGFALPMVMISGLSTFLPPEIALAALIVPALVTNLWQAFRNGVIEAARSARAHWRYIACLALALVFSAQLVTRLAPRELYLILGIPVTVFAALQLAGWRPRVRSERKTAAELGIGAFAGGFGGISGIWGPPTVLYLTALDTPKSEAMRVQGVVYGVGAILLAVAHLRSGVLNPATLPLSLAMLAPALVGIAVGFAVQDRMDQQKFRRWTLIVLVVAGLNLTRRAIFG